MLGRISDLVWNIFLYFGCSIHSLSNADCTKTRTPQKKEHLIWINVFMLPLVLCVCPPACAFMKNWIPNGLWILCLQKSTRLFCLLLSAEDSSKCQNSGVWHPDAAWISGRRLLFQREGEGSSVPHLTACLFDITSPRHLTTLSVFSCKAVQLCHSAAVRLRSCFCIHFFRYTLRDLWILIYLKEW